MNKNEQKIYIIKKIKEATLYDENQKHERIKLMNEKYNINKNNNNDNGNDSNVDSNNVNIYFPHVHPGSKKIFKIPFFVNGNSPMEIITKQKLSKHYICKDSFYALHHFGLGMRYTLQDHSKNNTIPIHGSTGKPGHFTMYNNKTLHPLLKLFFDNKILPLAATTKIIQHSTKNDNDDNDNNVVLELPSQYSKARLYRDFGWEQGWKITMNNENSETKVKRTDDEWLTSKREPEKICGRMTFKSYWDQNYPTLIIRNDHVNAQAERAAIGFRSGPWSQYEKDAFIDGYEKLGRKWKKIMQDYVPTRTNLSICTHAKRYLNKKKKQELQQKQLQELQLQNENK